MNKQDFLRTSLLVSYFLNYYITKLLKVTSFELSVLSCYVGRNWLHGSHYIAENVSCPFGFVS